MKKTKLYILGLSLLLAGCAQSTDVTFSTQMQDYAEITTVSSTQAQTTVSEEIIVDITPSKETALETAAEEVTAEVTEAVTEIVTEPVTEPVTQPPTEPVTEPVTQPPTEPVTQPPTEPVTEPVTQPPTEPVTEPATQPVVPENNENDKYSVVRAQYSANYESIATYQAIYSALKTMPIISIETQDHQEILSKTEYVTSIVDVINCNDEFKLSENAQVRVRGNSSAAGEIKPYRIKFEKKQGMLGLHGGEEFKNWVLLKPCWNLVPDLMAFKIFDAMNDYYVSDGCYVNVVVNGVYKGVYLLCEQTQVNKRRINVNEPKDGYGGIDVGYLLELDNYASAASDIYFRMDFDKVTITDINGETRQLKSHCFRLKSDIYSAEQKAFIEIYLKGVYKIVYEACEHNVAYAFDTSLNVVPVEGITPEQAVANVVDLDSVIDMIILQEIAHDYDVGEGSMYMAVDFSAGSQYPKLTFLAPWDYSWAFYYNKGTEGYFACTFQPLASNEDRSNAWYITFMKGDWFRERVKTRWKALYASGIIQATADSVYNYSKGARADLGDIGWEVDCAAKVCEFVKLRCEWLNSVWGN